MSSVNLKKLIAQKAKLEEQIAAAGEGGVKSLLQEFFDANPKLLAVGWAQWSPHFNDGDPCTFSIVNGICVTFGEAGEDYNGDEVEGTTAESARDDFDTYEGWADSGAEAQASLGSEIEEVLDSDLLESVFGDGVSVVAVRGKRGKITIDTQEEDHD